MNEYLDWVVDIYPFLKLNYFKLVVENKLEDIFSTKFFLLTILISIAVTFAETEGNFSTLK